ncbi:hypothetical protein ACG97_00890 [Vogesella sp. EB]|jgi:molybdate transport system regulatory protein|uniref:TOBE domain-containing protein n=1 Tax=Vogesella sp. EB TaxID=1526735 RepID=UPI00064D6B7B|nr:TOBE domain-containing protein [Vogesella sp. EB]KMJ54864.1 hypothetical protein ACG97_00890 [Vogesella sp. EB]
MSELLHPFAGKGTGQRIALLRAIREHGSISAAARQCQLSYKAAWQHIDNINNLSPQPLVARLTGGKGGGGTRLTALGEQLLDAWEKTGVALQAGSMQERQTLALLGRLAVRTSARNQLAGEISHIQRGAVNDTITLRLPGGSQLQAQITRESCDELALHEGGHAIALIKASWITLALPQAAAQIAIANRLPGKVGRITAGLVNSEVIVTLPGGYSLCAMVDNDSLTSLAIAVDDAVCALFSSQSVILGILD